MGLSKMTSIAQDPPWVTSRRFDAGDRDRFDRLYRRYFEYVRAMLRRLSGDEAAAEDLAQEVFLVVLAKLEGVDPEAGVRSWLFQVSRRVASHHRRKRGRERRRALASEAPAGTPSPEQQLASVEATRALVEFLDGLEPVDRALFLGAELDGVGVPRLATTLAINQNTAYSRLRSMRRKLRESTLSHRQLIPPWMALLAGGVLRGERATRWAPLLVLLLALLGFGVVGIGERWFGDGWGSGGADGIGLSAGEDGGDGLDSDGSGPDRARSGDGDADADADGLRGRFDGHFSGVVVDPDGRGVEGATVCAGRWQSMRNGNSSAPSCTTSGSDGRFRIEGVLREPHTLMAMAAGYRPGRTRALAGATVRIVLESGGVAVRGVVLDVLGGPIAEAWVAEEQPFGPSLGAVVLTDEQGAFELWAAPGSLVLAVGADGYATTFHPAFAPAEDLELRIAPSSAIAGVVVRAGTGSPVAGAHVMAGLVYRPGMYNNHGTATTTDEQGRFTVDGLQPGAYVIDVSAPDGYGRSTGEIELGIADRRDGVAIELSPGASIYGQVVTASTGEPCRDGIVASHAENLGVRREANVDGEGMVRLDGFELGTPVEVVVSCAGYQAAEFTVEPAAAPAEPHQWEVERGASVRGRVETENGEGVPGWTVTLMPGLDPEDPVWGWHPDFRDHTPRSTTTNADGFFELSAQRPGHGVLQAHGHGHPPVTEQRIEIPDDGLDDVTLVVTDSFDIRGTVVSAGKPVAGALVIVHDPAAKPSDEPWAGGAHHLRVKRLDPRGPYEAVSDERGRFALRGVPEGEYGVWVRRDAMDLPNRDIFDANLPTNDPLERLALDRDVDKLVLELPEDIGTIAGVVLDEEGAALPEAGVFVEPMSDPVLPVIAMGAPVRTDIDGRFEQTGLEPGTYRVIAYRRGGGTAMVENVALGDDVELRMAAAGRLSGTVVDASGKPVGGFDIWAAGNEITTRYYPAAGGTGAWAFDGLEAGNYVLLASANAETQEAYLPVTLAPGEQRDGIELRLGPVAAVSGRLVRKDGSPAKAVRVTAAIASGPDPRDVSFDGTDDAGRFDIEPVPPGPIIVRYYLEPAPGEEPVPHTLTKCAPEAGKTLELGTFSIED
jgi:RNA polymerase sigma-70 factor (ECF subfamily)